MGYEIPDNHHQDLPSSPLPKEKVEKRVTDKVELSWQDISSEKWREYIYPEGQTLRINAPSLLNVKRGAERTLGSSDSHRIQTKGDGNNYYIPSGWLGIKFNGGYEF